MSTLRIKKCPSCGSKNLKRIRKDWKSTGLKKNYNVPSLDYYVCPDCGEELFDQAAMNRIESYSPNLKKHSSKRKIAA